MEDFDDELREIKREIIESRGLVIKTNNLTNALAADIKSIARRQQGYERRMLLHSSTAYVVFVIVVFIALKIAWDARVDSVRAETESTRAKAARLEKELREVQQRDEQRMRVNNRAAALYDLIEQNKNADLIEQFDVLDKDLLSKTELKLFADASERARNQMSIEAYHTGLEHARTGRWHDAQQAFSDSIKYKDNAAHAPAALYQRAYALRKLGRQREAVPMLMSLSEASADKEYLDDATYLLSQCLVDIEAWNDAKNAMRSFLRRFPNSPFANDIRLQLADLNLKH